MKLSDALRLGEYALKPIYMSWIESQDGKPCSGCAVGRACIAAGYQVTCNSENIVNLSSFFNQTWPWTKNYKASGSMIIFEHLNHMLQQISWCYESYRWPMQRIADWVATIEPQDEPTTQPTHEVTHEVLDQPAHSHHDR